VDCDLARRACFEAPREAPTWIAIHDRLSDKMRRIAQQSQI